MTHVFEQLIVDRPYREARRCLCDELAASPPALAPFVLHMDRMADRGEGFRIEWATIERAPCHRFVGELLLRALGNGDAAVLEVRGEYLPPVTKADERFDLRVEMRIALVTARTLLQKIAAAIERIPAEKAAQSTLYMRAGD